MKISAISKFLKYFSFLSLFAILPVSAEEIKFHADSMTGKTGSKNDATKLMGNAFVQTETMEIKADTITLSGENFRYITAEGSVDGKNTESEMEFSCGKMKYDRTTKIARLEDSVHMKDTANDVDADAQIIEYDQNNSIATMQINVSIKQKDNLCTSAYALYRKEKQMLEMSGNPKIKQGEDSFRAQEITLNLDTQEIALDGRVSGTVSDTKKKEPEKSKEAVPEDKPQEKAESEVPAEKEDEKPESDGENQLQKEEPAENQNDNKTQE